MPKNQYFQWVDNPPKMSRGRKDSLWDKRLRPCLQRPNEWARVWAAKPNTAYRTAYLIQAGGLALPAGTKPSDWQATSRREGEVGYVYARFVGDPEKLGR